LPDPYKPDAAQGVFRKGDKLYALALAQTRSLPGKRAYHSGQQRSGECNPALRGGRKSWLFAGSPNGADAAATLYSLIETAKACGIDPYQYLRLLFEKIPYAQREADYTALIPQNLTCLIS
jgi:hypothetical protein